MMNLQTAEMFREALLEKFRDSVDRTIKVLAAIPPAKLDYKPHGKSMSMKDLAWHTVTAESWFIGGIAGNGWGKEDATPSDVPKQAPGTVAEIVEDYTRLSAARSAQIKSLSAAHLARDVDFMGV